MKKHPKILKNFRYFISYSNEVILLDIYNTRYNTAYQVPLLIPSQPDTPFGIMIHSNIQSNLAWIFLQCDRDKNILVMNKKAIIGACIDYIAKQVHQVNVVKYLIFANQEQYEYPDFSHSYTYQFSANYLIANVSECNQSLNELNMFQLFITLREAYKKTGRHIHDIQSLNLTAH